MSKEEPRPAHRIRLRGPWEVRAAGRSPGRMIVPGTLRDGGWAGFIGRVSFYRRFGPPSNLTDRESVWLAFEKVLGPAEVWLNGGRLGSLLGAGSFEATKSLAARNSLEVIVEATDDRCGVVGDVWLEIRPT